MDQELLHDQLMMDTDLSFLDEIDFDDNIDIQYNFDHTNLLNSLHDQNQFNTIIVSDHNNKGAHLTRKNQKMNQPKMINPSRERRQSEIRSLRTQVHELEVKLNKLTCALPSNTSTLCSNAIDNLWQQIAKRQKEAVRLASLENTVLKSKVHQQAKWIKSLQEMMQDRTPLKFPRTSLTAKCLPPFQATNVMPLTSPVRDTLLAQLHQAAQQLDSEMINFDLENTGLPSQTLKLDRSPNSSLLHITGTLCLVLPVSVHSAIQAVWQSYNLHKVASDIPKSSRAFLQVAAIGDMNIRNGFRTIEGNIGAQYDYNKSKASVVFEYVAALQTFFGATLNVQVTSWTVVETNSDEIVDDNAEEGYQSILRWRTKCLILSKFNGVQKKLPEYIIQKLPELFKEIQQNLAQQIENSLLDNK